MNRLHALLEVVVQRRAAIIVAGAVLLLDQLAKDVAVTLLAGGAAVPVGPLALTYTRNAGLSMGFFADLPDPVRLPLVLAMAVGALLLVLPLLAARVRPGALRQVAVALVLAGALGNLCDRLRYGWVVDFITLHPGFGWNAPVFNLADIAVIVGATLLVVQGFSDRRPPSLATQTGGMP